MSAGIAHEFRNATGTILGWARLAARTDDAGARARHLEAIQAEAEHVARVTGDFLFFARPERLEAAPCDLEALALEIAAEQKTLTPGVDVSVGGSFAPALADAALVKRALVNLVKNACEAAADRPGGGRVLLSGEGAAAGTVRIAVEDDGPGVSDEAAAKLFVPFATTKESGTGLGLALVAKIAALHRGSVSAGTIGRPRRRALRPFAARRGLSDQFGAGPPGGRAAVFARFSTRPLNWSLSSDFS
jgi:signal transduction histidine kinase